MAISTAPFVVVVKPCPIDPLVSVIIISSPAESDVSMNEMVDAEDIESSVN